MRKRAKTLLVATLAWSGVTACLLALPLAWGGGAVLSGAVDSWLLVHAGPVAMMIYPYGFSHGTFWLVFLLVLALATLGLSATGLRARLTSVLGVSVWFLSGWAVLLQGY